MNAVLRFRRNLPACVRSTAPAVRLALIRDTAFPPRWAGKPASLGARQTRDTRTAAPSTTHGSSGQASNIAASLTIRSSTARLRPSRIEFVATRPGAGDVAPSDQFADLIESVTDKIGEGGNEAVVQTAQFLGVIVAEGPTHRRIAQKRWVSDHHVGLWPIRLSALRRQDRVAAFDGLQRLQDRVARLPSPIRRARDESPPAR